MQQMWAPLQHDGPNHLKKHSVVARPAPYSPRGHLMDDEALGTRVSPTAVSTIDCISGGRRSATTCSASPRSRSSDPDDTASCGWRGGLLLRAPPYPPFSPYFTVHAANADSPPTRLP